MTSPHAKELFDKGIVQSGATETMGVRFNTREASTRLTENILRNLGISSGNIEDIQTVSADELQAAARKALQQTGEELQIPAALGDTYSMDWEPVVDGDFLPSDPVTEDSFAEAVAGIPLLIGSNLNEWSGFFAADNILETEELTEAIRAAYPDKEGLKADQIDTATIRLSFPRDKQCNVCAGSTQRLAQSWRNDHTCHGRYGVLSGRRKTGADHPQA